MGIACVILVFLLSTRIKAQISANDDVPITLVQNASENRAVCLDGSPAGYYYSAGSKDGINNWMIFLMGGGWCPFLPDCLNRSTTALGSTNNLTTYAFEGLLSSNATLNPDFHNWNRVVFHYCDGASFMGDSEVNFMSSNLQFRGSRIFTSIVDELLLMKGMNNAKNAILAGSSAGGIATILHCDEFRASLPNAHRLKCLSDAGFFIRGKNLPRLYLREGPFAAVIGNHNLTNLLPTSCTSRIDPKLCFFPEYVIGGIQTPLFLLNSVFDNIQILYSLKPNSPDDLGWDDVCAINPNKCSPPQKQVITEFRNAFLDAVEEIGKIPSRGMFINACFAHDYSDKNKLWNSKEFPKLMNMTVSEAVGNWYFDRSSVHLIDTKTDFPLNCNV